MPACTLNSAENLLDDIFATVGLPPASGTVRFTGRDPILPTPFRIGELGAAAIGAAAAQSARIYELRTGVAQEVGVDVVAAALAMRSSRQLVVNPPLPEPALRTVGTYRTGDGRWLFTQRLFPHHFQRQLEVLGCEPTEESITAAVARFDGQWLEDEMVQRGASAALVRTEEEWAEHPQAAAVASLPLLEIAKIGDSAPIPLPAGPRPLSGLRVLDVTRVLAGPTGARTLAEQGADVLRISSPRYPDNYRMMIDTGHGKRSTTLDFARGEDRDRVFELVAGADVFSQGYRPGALTAFGLGPDQLARIRPGIIAVSFSAFGRRGPWRERRGFDSVVQSVSGMRASRSTDRPAPMPANPLDYITGYLAAFGALVALERRSEEGGSYHVEVSLAQTGRYLQQLSRADADAVAALPAEPPDELVTRLSMHRDTELGALRYLAPVAQFPITTAAWELPSVAADHDDAEWASP